MDGNKAKIKPPIDSRVIMTEMIMPNDTNNLNNLLGGRLMHFMDIVGAISAQRHSNSIVVTASADNITFQKGIPLGNVITLEAIVTRAFNTSMEVLVKVHSENIPNGTKEKTNDAFMTFVAVDENGKPKKVPQLLPESDLEKKRYKDALKRREFRLILGGKISPNSAVNIKELFQGNEEP